MSRQIRESRRVMLGPPTGSQCSETAVENIIARTNAAYGIADRVYVTNLPKAKDLATQQQIRTLCIRISLRLQTAFGLRREGFRHQVAL